MTAFFYALHSPAGVDFACSDCLDEARAELIVNEPKLSIARLMFVPSECCGWCGLDPHPEATALAVDAYLDEADERSAVMGREWD